MSKPYDGHAEERIASQARALREIEIAVKQKFIDIGCNCEIVVCATNGEYDGIRRINHGNCRIHSN